MSQPPLPITDDALRARPFEGIHSFAENMHQSMSTTPLAGLFNARALYDSFIIYISHRIHRADQDPLNPSTSLDKSFIGQHHWLFDDLHRLSHNNVRWMCMWCIVMLQQKHFAWFRADKELKETKIALKQAQEELAQTLEELDRWRTGFEDGEL
jgi:hypothetical protein